MLPSFSVVPQLLVDVKRGLCGGKGGFGALMKGKQARNAFKKVTYQGACRDLHGRRIRNQSQDEQVEQWRQQREQEEKERKVQEKKRKGEAYHNMKASVMDEVLKDQKSLGAGISQAVKNAVKRKSSPDSAPLIPLDSSSSNDDAKSISKSPDSATPLDEKPNSMPLKKRKRKKRSLFEDDFLLDDATPSKKKRKQAS